MVHRWFRVVFSLLPLQALLVAAVADSRLRARNGTSRRLHTIVLHLNATRTISEPPKKIPSVGTLGCGVEQRIHPEDANCPLECPFLRPEPTSICAFTCVNSSQCAADDPLASYADPETMRCGVCKVPACAQCGATSRTCLVCQEGYFQSEGSCLSEDRWYWAMCYFVIVVVILILICYVVTLARRPVTNGEVCRLALNFRDEAKLHNPEGAFYSVVRTDLRNTYISGIGVMLHFRWQHAVLVYSCLVCLVLYLVAAYYGRKPAIMQATQTSDKVFDACNQNVMGQVEDVGDMENIFFFVTLGLYISTTIATIAFAVYQQRFAARTSQELTTMQDYVLKVSNLPRQPGTVSVEEELTKYFRDKLQDTGVEVIGVSPCWEYRKLTDEVADQILWDLNVLEEKYEEDHPSVTPRTLGRLQSQWEPSAFSDRLRDLDSIFGVKVETEDAGKIGPNLRGKKEVQALLQGLWTTEDAYLVLGSEAQRDTAYDWLRHHAPRYYRGGSAISVAKVDSEPETVLWASCGIRPSEFYVNLTLGILALILAVVMLDIFFYFPSIAWFLSVSDVKGMSQGGIQGTLLGMLVVICNQIIYFLIGKIADKLGFSTTDRHQRFYVVGYTVAVFANTVIDLFVVLLLAQGYSMEQAVELQLANDSSMSTKAIAESPVMQKAIFDQYTFYIFPSCLLTPFLIEPLANEGIFLLMTWIVRSRREVNLADAEVMLQCLPFDLARYGDILINVMLCAGTLAFTYRDLWIIFACLVISLLWILSWDRYRFLKNTTRANFVTPRLDMTAQYLSASVCAILASTLVFRAYGQKTGDGHGILEDLFKWVGNHVEGAADVIERDVIVVVIVIVALLHFAAHFYVLKNLVPKWSKVEVDHDVNVPYSTTARKTACNWFNSNPVFCLRSSYIYEHSPPCTMFRVGKEHILQENAAIGQHYHLAHRAELEHNQGTYELLYTGIQEVGKKLHEDTQALQDSVMQRFGTSEYSGSPRSCASDSPTRQAPLRQGGSASSPLRSLFSFGPRSPAAGSGPSPTAGSGPSPAAGSGPSPTSAHADDAGDKEHGSKDDTV